MLGNFLWVSVVKNPPSTAEAMSSTSEWGNRIPQAEWHSQKKKWLSNKNKTCSADPSLLLAHCSSPKHIHLMCKVDARHWASPLPSPCPTRTCLLPPALVGGTMGLYLGISDSSSTVEQYNTGIPKPLGKTESLGGLHPSGDTVFEVISGRIEHTPEGNSWAH